LSNFLHAKEFIFQNRVFTKSIISHLFLNHFHHNNSIYKISTPSYIQREGGNLQTDATQLFLFGPIPAKEKKLGLLSIYKFSLLCPHPSPLPQLASGEIFKDDVYGFFLHLR
jgi:hypothetical protein